jgi:hypothetical protein
MNNKDIYKNFIINNKTNKKIYYTQTPGGTIVKTEYDDDDVKSRLSLKSKFSNIDYNNKQTIKTNIINKIKNTNNSPESISSNNTEFDKMVQFINTKHNQNEFIDIDISNNNNIDISNNNNIDISNNNNIDISNNNNIDISNNNIDEKIIINIDGYTSSSSSSDEYYNEEIDELFDIIDTNKIYKENKFVNLFKKSILKKRRIKEEDEYHNNSLELNSEYLYNLEKKKKNRTTITASSSSFSFKTPEIPVDPKDLECCYKNINKCCCGKIIDKISNCKFFSRKKAGDLVILIDRDMMNMLHYSLSSSIISNYKYIRYSIPLLTNLILLISSISTIIYPDYYEDESFSWTVYFTIMLICYNYLFYLVTNWNIQKHYVERNIQSSKRKISYSFYYMFISFIIYYSLYYYYYNINKYTHIINYISYIGIYLFFTTCGACYYFVTTKLIQKGNLLHKWLHELKLRKPPLEEFYNQYNKHYKKIKLFAKYWNILIFLGFIMLTFNLPLDIISVIYYNKYYNIGSIIFKTILLIWYTYSICYYNFYNKYIPSYLYKNRIYNQYAIKGIEKYMTYRPIALNFYGFTISGHLIIKSLVLLFNFVLPTLYGLISNKLLSIKS